MAAICSGESRAVWHCVRSCSDIQKERIVCWLRIGALARSSRVLITAPPHIIVGQTKNEGNRHGAFSVNYTARRAGVPSHKFSDASGKVIPYVQLILRSVTFLALWLAGAIAVPQLMFRCSTLYCQNLTATSC